MYKQYMLQHIILNYFNFLINNYFKVYKNLIDNRLVNIQYLEAVLFCFNIVSHQCTVVTQIKDSIVDNRMCPEGSGISLGNLKSTDQIEFFRSCL